MSEWIRLTNAEDDQAMSVRSGVINVVSASRTHPNLTKIFVASDLFYVTETPDEVRALLGITT